MSSFCNEVFEAGNCDCGEEKKKVIFSLQNLLYWLLFFPYRCFNLKLGK